LHTLQHVNTVQPRFVITMHFEFASYEVRKHSFKCSSKSHDASITVQISCGRISVVSRIVALISYSTLYPVGHWVEFPRDLPSFEI
jgi:hypothetical protein